MSKGTKKSADVNKAYNHAMRRARARQPFLKSDGKDLNREETHDRKSLRSAPTRTSFDHGKDSDDPEL